MSDGENVSVYFNAEEAEELLTNGLDTVEGSRSALIKEAVAVYLGARAAGRDLGTDETNDAGDLKRWVHSMLVAHERRANPEEVERRLLERDT